MLSRKTHTNVRIPLSSFRDSAQNSVKALSGGPLFDNSDEWLTTREAAAYLKISEGVLRNMCCNGTIPYYKLERRNRYRKIDLRNLLEKKGGSNER